MIPGRRFTRHLYFTDPTTFGFIHGFAEQVVHRPIEDNRWVSVGCMYSIEPKTRTLMIVLQVSAFLGECVLGLVCYRRFYGFYMANLPIGHIALRRLKFRTPSGIHFTAVGSSPQCTLWPGAHSRSPGSYRAKCWGLAEPFKGPSDCRVVYPAVHVTNVAEYRSDV